MRFRTFASGGNNLTRTQHNTSENTTNNHSPTADFKHHNGQQSLSNVQQGSSPQQRTLRNEFTSEKNTANTKITRSYSHVVTVNAQVTPSGPQLIEKRTLDDSYSEKDHDGLGERTNEVHDVTTYVNSGNRESITITNNRKISDVNEYYDASYPDNRLVLRFDSVYGDWEVVADHVREEESQQFRSFYMSSHGLTPDGRAEGGMFFGFSVTTDEYSKEGWDDDQRPPDPEDPEDIEYEGEIEIGEFQDDEEGKLYVMEFGSYHDDAQGLRHTSGNWLENESGSQKKKGEHWYRNQYSDSFVDIYELEGTWEQSWAVFRFGSYGPSGTKASEIWLSDKTDYDVTRQHFFANSAESGEWDEPEVWENTVNHPVTNNTPVDDDTPSVGGGGWRIDPSGAGGASQASPAPDPSEFRITPEMAERVGAPLFQVWQEEEFKGLERDNFLKPDFTAIQRYGGLSTVYVFINMNATSKPDSLHIDYLDNIQKRMQEAVNNAGLPLHIILVPFSPTSGNEPTDDNLGQQVSISRSFSWTHRVQFGPTPPLHQTGGPARAITTDRVNTTINDETASREYKEANPTRMDQDIWYANILLHEVFWQGILGRLDQNQGGSPLASGLLQRQLIQFTPDEIADILNEFGYESP